MATTPALLAVYGIEMPADGGVWSIDIDIMVT
jgi:hypothetical protein